jgi:hypothetical protein
MLISVCGPGAALAFLAIAIATAYAQPGAAPLTLRFHHLHYRVADPGAALGEAADAFEGTRTILQGLGVGVRAGREYVLFDRAGPGDSSRRRGLTPAAAYAQAASWLAAKGVVVQPPSLAATAVARALDGTILDHVAFAADDPGPAIAALGVKPFSANGDRALFKLSSGALLEIVRNTDRPDAFWCPMHLDVRAPATARCPICAMPLVPIPAPRVGEYKLDATLVPRAGGGAAGLTLTVRDPDTGQPVTSFIDVHERPLHLFVISRDLSQFAHVHPEMRADGTFELRHDLADGEYMLVADFLPTAGTAQFVQRAVVTPGYTGSLFAPAPVLTASPVEQVAGGLRIRLEPESLRPRRESLLRFVISEVDSGLPVTDLQPYLGAAGHMLVVSSDLTAAVHGHPEGISGAGPIVTFGPVFPAPGMYKMWVQFQRRGQVVTASFVVTVPEG